MSQLQPTEPHPPRLHIRAPFIPNSLRRSLTDVAEQIDALKLGARLPKATDLEGMAKALVRLHDTYDLDLDRLADGEMMGIQTAASEWTSRY